MKKKIFPDLIVHLEETYPFRDKDLIDDAIKVLLKNGYDTVIAAKERRDGCGKKVQTDTSELRRRYSR